jgi:hypothetical protein
MMMDGTPEGKAEALHKKFTGKTQKTYRNQLVRVVFRNEEFQSIYKGKDKRGLGLHSKRKMSSTYCKRRGAHADQVDHRGRWVNKKGSRVVTGVYIDPEDIYADAVCASKLALGGAIKYKLKSSVAGSITTGWLADNVVPSIAKRYADDLQFVHNLGLAKLWLALDEEASADLKLDTAVKDRVKSAYDELPVQGDRPEQPIDKIALHVYRSDNEDTLIDEMLPPAPRADGDQSTTVEDELARIPATGGSNATQHVLQTLVLQNRLLTRQVQELESRITTIDRSNRAYMEDQFRRLNGNIRRFGGTIQGAAVRQDPRRREEVRRAIAEGPAQRGRPMPRLAPNVKDLMQLWQEYEQGIAGRKAARLWSAVERGGGGNREVKQMYYRRNNIWRLQQYLIDKGYNIQAANALIEQTYGKKTSMTKISKEIAADRTRYKANGGLHPNFR